MPACRAGFGPEEPVCLFALQRTAFCPRLLLAANTHAACFSCLLQGSPRSGSGSERSATSAPIYLQRRIPGGMLGTTHAYSNSLAAAGAARSSFSADSRSGSEEMQPLLYGTRGQHLQPAGSYAGSGNSYRAYPAAGSAAAAAHQQHQHQQQEDKAPVLHKCPRCRKEYLSTINQRRCISSHLGASSGRAARSSSSSGGIPGVCGLALLLLQVASHMLCCAAGCHPPLPLLLPHPAPPRSRPCLHPLPPARLQTPSSCRPSGMG